MAARRSARPGTLRYGQDRRQRRPHPPFARSDRWYRPTAVTRRTAAPVALLAVAGAVALAGCGQSRQDAHAPTGTFPVAVVRASFAREQSLSSNQDLVIAVRNTGTKTIPNLAVTVNGLSAPIVQAGVASAQRPLWIVDEGPGPHSKLPVQGLGAYQPGGYVTYLTNTWAAGPLAAGHTVTFVWGLTPVKAGLHLVHYRVATDLYGKTTATLAGGGIPAGSFAVAVVAAPPRTHVDPATGQVVPGPAPNAG